MKQKESNWINVWKIKKNQSEISNFTVSKYNKYLSYVVNKINVEVINSQDQKIILKKTLKKFEVQEIQFLNEELGIVIIQEQCKNLKIIYFDQPHKILNIKLPFLIQYLDKFFYSPDILTFYIYQNDQIKILDRKTNKCIYTLKFDGQFRLLKQQSMFLISVCQNKVQRFLINKTNLKSLSKFQIKGKVISFELSNKIMAFNTLGQKQKILSCDYSSKKIIRQLELPISLFVNDMKLSQDSNFLCLNSGIQIIVMKLSTNLLKYIILKEKVMDEIQMSNTNEIFYLSEKYEIKKLQI